LGETLRTASGVLTHVTLLTLRPGSQSVYNLEIDSEHVYNVSSNGLLVHNACQDHHAVPYANKKYNHQNHPLVKKVKVDLKTYAKNLRPLKGHKGRHLEEYHRQIAKRLDNAYKPKMSQAKAKAALDRTIGGAW
jgi:hypothetical protein